MSVFNRIKKSVTPAFNQLVADTSTNIVGRLGDSIGRAASSALGGVQQAINASQQDSETYYKVYISAQVGDQYIFLVADCPSEFSFGSQIEYETPYQNFVEDKIPIASEASKFFGTKLLTQALTAKIWSGAADTVIQLPLVFHAVQDADEDVLKPLAQLMFLSMPREEVRGGFLSSPGPQFDIEALANVVGKGANATIDLGKSFGSALGRATNENTNLGTSFVDTAKQVFNGNVDLGAAISKGARAFANGVNAVNPAIAALSNGLASSVKNPISLRIGNFLQLDSVVIENVQQTHTVNPVGDLYGQSSGINSKVAVEVTFKTFYTLTQRDILQMLIPAANGRAPKTAAKINELTG